MILRFTVYFHNRYINTKEGQDINDQYNLTGFSEDIIKYQKLTSSFGVRYHEDKTTLRTNIFST